MTTPDPIEHDTKLYKLLQAEMHALGQYEMRRDRLGSAADPVYVGHRYDAMVTHSYRTRMTPADDLAAGTLVRQEKTYQRGEAGLYVTGEPGNYIGNRRRVKVQDLLDRLPDDHQAVTAFHKAQAAVTDAEAAIVEHEKAYTGWSRFFLVTSSAGHVHSSMRCVTCYPQTRYAPVVGLSGSTEEQAAAILGDTLCSVCFPSVGSGRPSKIAKRKVNELLKTMEANVNG